MNSSAKRPYNISPHLSGNRQVSQKAPQKKRRPYLLIFPLVALLLIGYLGAAFARPLPEIQPHITQAPSIDGKKAIIMWPSSGQVAIGAVDYGLLGSKGNETPVPTASTIKVLTALTVLKQKPLTLNSQGPSLILDSTDVDFYNQQLSSDGSTVAVEAGESISEYQALQALMLPSANNMAYTLAYWSYGSIDAFLSAANQEAAQLGMTHTKVTDPSGLSPTTISTASDMVQLGIAAAKNPVLTQIVSQKRATIPVEGEITNVDTLLGNNDITGIKTGNTDQAGGCFLGSRQATVGGKSMTIITAIMDDPDLGTALHDTPDLGASTASNFIATEVAKKGAAIATYAAPWATTSVTAKTLTGASLVRWSGEKIAVSTAAQPVEAGETSGTKVGTISARSDKGAHTVADIALSGTIPKPSLWWRLTHVF